MKDECIKGNHVGWPCIYCGQDFKLKDAKLLTVDAKAITTSFTLKSN